MPHTTARPCPPLRLRRLVLALLTGLLACAGVLCTGAGTAGAHAALLGSDPKQGSVLRTAPTQVSLTFSEQVAIDDGAVRVLDPAGREVATGKVSYTGSDTYRVPLRADLQNGTYTVAYQVLSADSHPVSGAYTFSVGAPSSARAALPDQQAGGGVVGALYDTGRYVSYGGFVLLVGGAVFVLACWPSGAGVRAVQRLVVSGWVALTAATLALLLMRGAYTGSGRFADVFDLSLLGDVLPTRSGTALVSRLLLLAVAAVFLAVLFGAYARRHGTRRYETEAGAADGARTGAADGAEAEPEDGTPAHGDLAFGIAVGGAVVAVGLAATWATSEHASVGLQTRVAVPVDVVHLLAVATWLGGLVALLTVLYRVPAPGVTAAAVRRFSALAFCSVLVLVATGLYQTWRQVGSWTALTGTEFGQLLLVKVGLVAVVVAIASGSRRWTARLTDDLTATGTTTGTTTATTTGTMTGTTTSGTSTSETATSGTSARSAVVAHPAAAGPTGPADPTGTAEPIGTATEPAEPAGSPEPPEPPEPTEPAGAAATPERAAQLARQQAARAAARRRQLRDADPARSALRRSVLAEAVVAVALLAVTTVLTSTETGRTAEAAAHAANTGAGAGTGPETGTETGTDTGTGSAGGSTAGPQQPSGPVDLTFPYDTGGGPHPKGTVKIHLTPAHPGANDLRLVVEDADGGAVEVPEVRVRLTLKARHLGPLSVTLKHTGHGRWTASGVQVPMAGTWQVSVSVRTSDIDEVTVYKNAKIG